MATVTNTPSSLNGHELVITGEVQTLTNKTLTTPVISGSGGTLTLPAGPDTLVGRATTDTLTNKTLTAPVIATVVSGGQTVTIPAATDTLVGRATVDTLTNKTINVSQLVGSLAAGLFPAAAAWTPVLGGATSESGQSYSAQLGRYIRFGPFIVFWGSVVFSAKGTITGGVVIKGLPVAAASNDGSCLIPYFVNLANPFANIFGLVSVGGTLISLLTVAAGGATDVGGLAAGDLTNTTGIRFGGFYEV